MARKPLSTSLSGTEIVLPPLNLEEIRVTIIGETPLITHAWSEKAKKEMLGKHLKKAKQAREAKEPEQDYLDSLYHIEGGGYGFPSVALKDCMVTACTSVSGITKVAARQAFRVVGIQALVRGAWPGLTMRQDLVEVLGSEPQMREDMVRVGMGQADIRYRAQFWPWYMSFHIGLNQNVLSPEQLFNLLNVAGFGVGIGEWRSERNGQSGAFRLATEADIQELTSPQSSRKRKAA